MNDVDTGDSHSFTIVSGDPTNVFAINAITGEITVADDSQLDHETTPIYTLVVEAEDAVGSQDTATITINVTDVNESPTISLTNLVTSLSEANAAGSKVADIVVDDDGTGTNNLLLSGADANLFEIMGTELWIKSTAIIDFETQTTLNVTVEVDDPALPALPDDDVAITVNITDSNDNAPVVDSGIVLNVDENVANGTVVGTVTAMDVDTVGGPFQNWTITAGNGAGVFAINSNSGQITVANGALLDFETTSSYSLSVTVSDGVNTSAVGTVAIHLDDVNEAPAVSLINVVSSLSESTDTSGGVVIADIVINDDALGNETLSLSGDDASAFVIVGMQLRLQPSTVLDYETQSMLDVTVEIDDASLGSTFEDSVAHMLTIIDENDNVPVIGLSQNFTVNEAAHNGTSLGFVAATDVDTVGALQGWTIQSGNVGNVFEINATTGELTVVDNTNLDFETLASYTLVVSVDDGFNTSAPESIAITVTNANEGGVGSITDTSTPPNEVVENSAPGNSVGLTAFATDPDVGDTVTYSLTNDAGGRFQINTTTGVVTTGATAIDAEAATSHLITVKATSTDGSESLQDFTINVLDQDEFAITPINDSDTASDEISELAGTGTPVGITAFADDLDVTDSVSYSLTNNAGGLFSIDALSGVVSLAGALDYETNTSHSIAVEAISSGGGVVARSFTINIVDENDNPPVVATGLVSSIPENAANNAFVIQAHANDLDTVGTLHNWEIVSGDPAEVLYHRCNDGSDSRCGQYDVGFRNDDLVHIVRDGRRRRAYVGTSNDSYRYHGYQRDRCYTRHRRQCREQ